MTVKESSKFTKIINRELHAHIIYEDERTIAFLTHLPVAEGHVLLVPKKQIDDILQMDHDDYCYLWEIARKIGLRIKEVYKSPRVGIVVEGFNVPHVHIHLFPIYKRGDVQNRDRLNLSEDEFVAIAALLRF